LGMVVEEALSMFAQPAASKGLELVVQIDPPDADLSFRGDPFRLRQVFVNLVSNAIKFTPAGKVLVRGAQAETTAADARLCVCVEDSGIGIPPAAQGRIFEQFSQADGSTTRQYGGTGLGLAICARLVGMMNGRIRVESTPGQGSRFFVEMRLPRSLTAAPAPHSSPRLHGAPLLRADLLPAPTANIVATPSGAVGNRPALAPTGSLPERS